MDRPMDLPAAKPLQRHTAPPEAAGVKLIVAYKVIKAIVELALAITLAVLVSIGYLEHAHNLALAIKEHLVHHWSIRLAEAVLRNLTARRIYWVIAAIVGDSFISGFEGWALRKGYLWAPWLVVGATATLLPIEIEEIIRHITFGRVIIFFVNAFIVIYLARGAWRAHKQHKLSHQR